VIALSEEVKRKNRYAYTLTPGKFFWRKMKLILHWFFVTKNPQAQKMIAAKDKKFRPTFAKNVILFGRNNLRLPTK